MIALNSSRYLITALFIAILVFFLSSKHYGGADSTPSGSSIPNQYSSSRPLQGYFMSASAGRKEIQAASEIGRASNATLGFEQIFVLGLPDRSDKRDAMVLSASLTGFDVQFIVAVEGDGFPDKARPPGLNLKGGAMGCWRSHLNVIRSVIENKIASAFIMEDDADWDIRLLSQLPKVAEGVRSLSNISLPEHQNSPYGDDWDVLWLGHCGDIMPKNDDRKYIIENDDTVAAKAHQTSPKALEDMPEQTRIVHKAGAPICTFGYGVSYRGAQKIILALGIKAGANLAIDNGLAFLCQDGYLDIKCYSVEPKLFHHHRPAGSVSKNSDIVVGNSTKVRDKGFTDNIVLSARLNLEQVMMGSTEYIKQW